MLIKTINIDTWGKVNSSAIINSQDVKKVTVEYTHRNLKKYLERENGILQEECLENEHLAEINSDDYTVLFLTAWLNKKEKYIIDINYCIWQLAEETGGDMIDEFMKILNGKESEE